MLEILYEDAALAVCIKPVGAASQGTSPDALPALLAAQLQLPEVFPIHRLDQAVGGVMVFAKTPACAAELSRGVQDGSFRKEYLAVTQGVPAEAEGELQDLLFHDRQKNKTYVVKKRRAGVRPASLRYRVLAQKDGCALVQVQLQTGRTHQIRVQFATRGLPLLGDGKYGSRENRCTAALWSFRVSFRHPDGTRRSFTCPPPEAYPWELFQGEIAECTEAI